MLQKSDQPGEVGFERRVQTDAVDLWMLSTEACEERMNRCRQRVHRNGMAGNVPATGRDGNHAETRRVLAPEHRARDVEQASNRELTRALEVFIGAPGLDGIKGRGVHDVTRLDRFDQD